MRKAPSAPEGREESEVRRGPWTREEDNQLVHYIALHGEGRWNLLAKCAGLKRTGKSCRLRWLNYLKPDVKRGNLSPQEQLLILELHFKWGNRWSKIAQHLPGRTDNEIKNYWRTRVKKQARQLNIESNSKRFLDAIRILWMPRLLEKARSTSSSLSIATSVTSQTTSSSISPPSQNIMNEELPNYRNSCEIYLDMGKPTDQLEDILNFEGTCFNSMGRAVFNIDDVDAMSALGPNDVAPSFLCHVDESDVMGHAVDEALWANGGLW